MSDLLARIENLSPARRQLLERLSAKQSPLQTKTYPLSYSQQRLWFLDQLEPLSAAYNMPMAIKMVGDLNRHVFWRALREIVRRHEVLRTRFPQRNGVAVQEVAQEFNLAMEEIDLRHVDAETRSAMVAKIIQEEVDAPFDLAHGPLLRTKLLQVAEKEHILAMTMHHIVSDGWSMKVMEQEFVELYRAYLYSRPSPLPELEFQYGDFAIWQRGWLQSGVMGKQLEYWKKKLAGVEELNFPTDYPHLIVRNQQGAYVNLNLGTDLSKRLKDLCQREGVTLFMALLAGFQTAVARENRLTDLVVGTPIANRNRMETENLIGFFINTLLLRTTLDRGMTFRDVLKQVQETALEAYEHQDLPFEKLVEVMPRQELNRTPLFQVLFVLQNIPPTEINLPGLKLSGVDFAFNLTKVELTLTLGEDSDRIEGSLQYDTMLFSERRMRRLAESYRRVLNFMVQDAGQRIMDASLLEESERERVLKEWGRGEKEEEEEGTTVQEEFERQAERGGERVAVEYEGERLTYEELNERGNELGWYLREEEGVGAEVCVGICMERCVEMVVGMLGVLKAGGAYVPLDAGYPEERLRYMVEEAGVEVVLVDGRGEEVMRRMGEGGGVRGVRSGRRVVKVKEEWGRIAEGRQGKGKVKSGVRGENLAYVMYTSGSTGKPKGVGIPHRALWNQLAWAREAFGIKKDDRFLQKSSFSFDTSVEEILTPLVAGARTVLAKSGGEMDVEYLVELVATSGVTCLDVTPSLLGAIVQQGKIHNWESVRLMISGGEELRPELVRKYSGQCRAELWNTYGPTEATVQSTYAVDVVGKLASDGEVRIGKPIVGVEVYVVEEGGGLVGEGVVGELCIGGAGLGRGYVKRGDLTGERFVPNPFSEGRGERMYRTGDLVRWSEGGELEYEGRVDEQVKVRGYRIEVGEVEEVMKREEGVGEAAVVVAGGEEEGGKGKRLVGYVVRRKEEGGSGEKWLKEMRERMREELPEYMVPWVVEELEEMPRLPNGKLDRKKLGRMAGGVVGKGGRGEYEGPGNAGEEILCGIWEEVLGQERVGVRDNFFEMGGHSLLAMQMISRVRGVFGVELALRRLFEKPTVRGLGEEIERERRKGKRREVPELKRREGVGGRRKLSYAQQRLWFLDELEPGKARYNIPVGVRLEGELDKEALRKSLEEIVRRHEILRTRIVEEDGEVMQEVEEAGKWRMEEEEDLRGWGEGEREEELKRRVKEEGERAFDLRAGGLFRGKLLRMGEKDHVLMVVMHHIVSDGWSMGVMEGEFVELYRGYVEGREAGLGELEYQYGDYAEWQREWLQGEMLEEQVGYWREQLEGVEGLDLRMGKEQEEEEEEEEEEGKKKSGGVDGEGGEVVWELSAEVSRELVEMSRREGVTLFMLMLAGYQLMLSRYSGKRDVTVGVPIAGRRWSETEGMIGFFVNTLAMRSRWRGEESFVEMLRGVRERSLEAYEHQDVPFEKLVEELRPERDLRRAPLFQVMFVMEKAEGKRREMELPGIRVGGVEMGGGMEKFEMTMTVVEGGRGRRIGGGLSYRKELFSKRSMERMMRQWERLMGEIAKDPQRRVEEYSLLEESERERVLEEWNATGVEIPDGCVHRLFEEQAELRPDAIAVVSGEKSLTYGELNARANQLAHYLRSCGVTAETGVALCCERSLELIVGMLGIVKAGGAYVPLDASYPRERLRWMLEDANVAVLLTAQGKDKELPEGAYLRLRLDEDWERIAEKSRENPVAVSGAGNLAYIIYTSGSTGEPKGVAVEHRGIVRLVRGANFFEVSADDVFLQFGSVTFDVSTFEVWGALGNGARLVMAPPHMPTMEELGEVIEGSGVTVLWLTSGLFQQMVETQLERMRGVKQFLAGGDVVSVAHMRKVGEAMPECALINGYGPTENTTFTACYRRKGDGGELSSFPIGKAISNTSVYVLDEGLEAVPVGVAGELYTGGKGLARGYVGKGDLTGERFVPNPFSEVGGERMYGTGDLVRWGEDGNLEFLGRKDQQVKVRGYRIELGEIEEALLGCEGVRQAVVVAAGGGGGGGEGGGREKRLVGYVVEGEEGQVGESELRERLRERLPEYMVPAAIEKMKEIPLNASGKVDRKKLTGMASEAKILNDGMAPRDFVELELTRLCQELLGRDGIGIRDNFFDLGGHSLLAIRLISMIHRKFNVRIPLAAIFQHPSIEALAPLLRTEGPAVPLTCAIELKRGSKRPLFFVHGAGGSAFSFVELARSMNADRSFIAFQDAGIEHGSGSTSIEGMAAQYVEAIGDFQPEGPYLLGGWSMGGMIAFEMARLLRSQGRVVDFLALVDSHPPALTGRRKAEGVEITLQNFLLMMGIKEEIAPVTDITTPIEKRLEIAHRQAMEAELVPSGLDLAVFQRLFEVYCRHSRAVESYRPRHCDLTLHLWQATGVSLVKGKEDGGTARAHKLVESHQAAAERRWQKLTAEVHINRIAGDHFSILREPHVRALANALDLALDRVDFEFDRDKSLTG